MKHPLLFYRFGAMNEPATERALQTNGIPYVTYSKKMKDYHADSELALELTGILHRKQIGAVFSYDYFPLLSMLCEVNQIPYLSWIYDCPLYTLQSKTIVNPSNYIFCFDRIYAERLMAMGAQHCFHVPLAAESDRRRRVKEMQEKDTALQAKYACDISFLGALYNEENNRLRRAEFDAYTRGYLEGIMQAQMFTYGCNFIREALSPEVVQEIAEKCRLKLGELYVQDETQMAADMIGREVSARERCQLIERISDLYDLQLYTGSKLPEALQKNRLHPRGYADYEKEMPHIFYSSRINLNMTSKTIESGIPLRVFDILSCGGFCLTNYQPEIAEYFEDGKELVMFSDPEELLLKAEYYLTHEEERAQIAEAGYQRLCAEHELSQILMKLFIMAEISFAQ